MLALPLSFCTVSALLSRAPMRSVFYEHFQHRSIIGSMRSNKRVPMRSVTLFLLGALLTPVPATAMPEEAFRSCVEKLKEQARSQRISSSVINEHLASVSFVPRVIELDRAQPEFTTSFADYMGRRVTEDRVARGRALLAQHRPLLNEIAAEYGVPAQYLVAFWGLETNYGSFFGRMSVLDSLATLACEGRRGPYFSEELINALKIIDEGAISASRMEGSWAGAMGHVQFMPSVFLRYAVDYDRDGRRDLWGSIPDAMASAANFLRGIGWQEGQRWGREVQLPADFPYHKAGRDRRLSLEEWQRLGVRRPDGSSLPIADFEAALLVPAGHTGPAFLVYDNFHVIMRWNRSEFYALSVGHLADRINGAGNLAQTPPDAPRLNREQVMTLQQRLNEKGFDSGEPDGVIGPATRAAISRFQQDRGMVADGFASADLLAALGVTVGS